MSYLQAIFSGRAQLHEIARKIDSKKVKLAGVAWPGYVVPLIRRYSHFQTTYFSDFSFLQHLKHAQLEAFLIV